MIIHHPPTTWEPLCPRGTMLGLILWKIYSYIIYTCSIYVHQWPAALSATFICHTDNRTLSQSYVGGDISTAVEKTNEALRDIAVLGLRWQVKFDQGRENTGHGMAITLTTEAAAALQGNMLLRNETFTTEIKYWILSAEYDIKLTFKEVALKANVKVTALRRMKQLLDERGLQILHWNMRPSPESPVIVRTTSLKTPR